MLNLALELTHYLGLHDALELKTNQMSRIHTTRKPLPKSNGH